MRKILLILAALFVVALCPACKESTSQAAQRAAKAPQLEPMVEGEEVAIMETTMGTIKIRFFPEYAPKAVENFKTHAKNGYYNGVIFHRVIKDFMIQSGDPLGNGTGGESIWKTPFVDEFTPDLHNIRGALSMANSGSNTNGSQFFIVQNKFLQSDYVQAYEDALKDMSQVVGQDANGKDVKISDVFHEKVLREYIDNGGTPHLDYVHTVFGQVYEGMDIVDNIAETPTVGGEGSDADKPKTDVVINKITIEKYAK